MTASLRLPRLLADTLKTSIEHEIGGETVAEALEDLFSQVPGLRNHLITESGEIRPHLLLFVDSERAGLSAALEENSRVRVLQAVSGG